jgi:L-seryl-tRNA(Ser) seleniumtransferase
MTDLRFIPSIEQLRQRTAIQALERQYGREAAVEALRAEAGELRQKLAGTIEIRPSIASHEDAARAIEQGVAARLRQAVRPSLVSVINATGVIIHTNLGRAPLAEQAVERIAQLAVGYTNLEFDLEGGRRGRRDTHAEALLCRLTGAEAAIVVNNNAAAALIVLSALAAGREVIISRGELVEIGGGFRVPDVMAQSGAILREVGTTNRTRVADYAAAITERTALILRVHPSNFRIEGFTERPELAELAALGHRFELPVVEDLGSGNVGVLGRAAAPESGGLAPAMAEEPAVQESLGRGADVIVFSGDKLLGGPQAGLILGKRDLVARVRAHPLMRALRVDKLTYAALEATLIEYASGRALETVPVARMLAGSAEQIDARARRVRDRIAGNRALDVQIVAGFSTIGGGSAPGASLPTRLLSLAFLDESADALQRRLRRLDPPIIARIDRDRVVLDLRTVQPGEDERLATLLATLSAD